MDLQLLIPTRFESGVIAFFSPPEATGLSVDVWGGEGARNLLLSLNETYIPILEPLPSLEVLKKLMVVGGKPLFVCERT